MSIGHSGKNSEHSQHAVSLTKVAELLWYLLQAIQSVSILRIWDRIISFPICNSSFEWKTGRVPAVIAYTVRLGGKMIRFPTKRVFVKLSTASLKEGEEYYLSICRGLSRKLWGYCITCLRYQCCGAVNEDGKFDLSWFMWQIATYSVTCENDPRK